MPKTKKKAAPAKKKAAKKKAPAKAKKTVKAKKNMKASNVLSFTELFELKKKKMAEFQQQQGWKNGTTGVVSVYTEQPKALASVRNGRTNGAGSRHK
jgi:hypothetical protein